MCNYEGTRYDRENAKLKEYIRGTVKLNEAHSCHVAYLDISCEA